MLLRPLCSMPCCRCCALLRVLRAVLPCRMPHAVLMTHAAWGRS
jgi:hypothetical protein